MLLIGQIFKGVASIALQKCEHTISATVIQKTDQLWESYGRYLIHVSTTVRRFCAYKSSSKVEDTLLASIPEFIQDSALAQIQQSYSKEQADKQTEREPSKPSSLHDSSIPNKTVTLEELDTVVKNMTEDPMALGAIIAAKSDSPKKKEEFRMIQEGENRLKKLLTSHDFDYSSTGERNSRWETCVTQTAQSAVESVRNLKAGERWLFSGSCGKKEFALGSTISKGIEQCKRAGVTIDPVILQLAQSGFLRNPIGFVTTFVKGSLEPMTQEALHLLETFGLGETDNNSSRIAKDLISHIDTWMPHSQRTISPALAKRLPRWLAAHLDSWAQEGILSGFLEFVPPGSFYDHIKFFINSWSSVRTAEQRMTWIKDLEERLLSRCSQIASGSSINANHLLETMTSTVTSSMPFALKNFVESAILSDFADVWFEIVKEKNQETFTVLVYGSGAAQQYHPLDFNGRIQWPLRCKNVSKEELNERFFYCLIEHTLEACRNPVSRSSTEAIFGPLGVVAHLGQPNLIPRLDKRAAPLSRIKKIDMVDMRLSDPKLIPGMASFILLRNTLVQACRPFLVGEKLSFPDVNTAQQIELAAEKTMAAAERVKEKLPPNQLDQLHSMYKDIHLASIKIEPVVQSPVQSATTTEDVDPSSLIWPTITGFLKGAGLPVETLTHYTELFVFAFGEEFRTPLETLAKTFSQKLDPSKTIQEKGFFSLSTIFPPSAPAEKESSTPPTGWIRTLLYGTQPQLSSKIKESSTPAVGWIRTILYGAQAQMAWKIFGLYQVFSQIYFLGANFTFTLGGYVSYLGWQIAPHFIPVSLRIWLRDSLSALQHEIYGMFCTAILRAVISPEKLKELQSQIKPILENILDKRKIDFRIEPAQTCVKEIPISLKPSKEQRITELPKPSIKMQKLTEPPKATIEMEKFFDDTPCENWELYDCEAPLHAENMHEVLSSWKTIREPALLALQLLRLELPNKTDLWEKVENPSTIIETLSELSLEVADWRDRPHLHAEKIIILHRILAIMDCLERNRSHSPLKNGLSINGCDLIIWFQGDKCQMRDDILLRKAEETIDYFYPGLDLHTHYDKDAIKKMREDRWFSYPTITPNGILSDFRNNGNPFFKPNHFPELVYYEKLLKKNENNLHSRLIEYRKENGQVYENLSFQSQIVVLANSVNFFLKAPPLVPKSFAMLRFQSLLCSYCSRIDYCLQPFYFGKENVVNQRFPKDIASSFFIQIQRVQVPLGMESINEPKKQKEKPTDPHIKTYTEISEYLSPHHFSQSEIMQNYHRDSAPTIQTLHLLMSRVDPKDQIARLCAWIHRKTTPFKKIDLFFFIACVSRPYALESFLEDSPESIDILYAACKKLLSTREYQDGWMDCTLDYQPYENLFCLILYIKKRIRHLHPTAGAKFEKIEGLLRFSTRRKDAALNALLLNSKEQLPDSTFVIMNLLSYSFFPAFKWDNFENGPIEQSLVKMRVERNEQIRAIFNCQKERNSLCRLILSQLQIPLPGKESADWTWNPAQGIATLGSLLLDFNRGIVLNIRSMQSNSSSQQESIEHLATIKTTISYNEPSAKKWVDLPPTIKKTWKSKKNLNELLFDSDSGTLFSVAVSQPISKEIVEEPPVRSELETIPPSQFPRSFQHFRSFCPLDQITCHASPGCLYPTSLSFDPYSLSFSVKQLPDGSICAFSEEIQGYWVASEQSHVGLGAFPSYLLLENQQKQKIVLIPKRGLAETTGYGILVKYTGLLGTLARNAISSSANEFYQYYVDETGLLRSDNPQALAYLILLYVMQYDAERALAATEELERVGRLHPLPRSLHNQLIPLAFFPIPVAEKITVRLFSLLQENSMLHAEEGQKIPEIMDLEDKLGLLLSLYCLKRDTYMDSYQQWLLFKKCVRHLKGMLSLLEIHPSIKKTFLKIGWEALVLQLLPQKQKEGIECIEKAHSVTLGIVDRVQSMVQHLPFIPSFLPDMNLELGSLLSGGKNTIVKAGVDSLPSLQKFGMKFSTFTHKEKMASNYCPIEDLPLPSQRTLIPLFLTYYSVAEGKQGEKKKKWLQDELGYIQTGWNDSSKELIRLLLRVCNVSLLDSITPSKLSRLSSNALQKKLSTLELELQKINKNKPDNTNKSIKNSPFIKASAELTKFFEDLHSSLNGIEQGKAIGKIAKAGIAHIVGSTAEKAINPAAFISSALYWPNKMYQAYQQTIGTVTSTLYQAHKNVEKLQEAAKIAQSILPSKKVNPSHYHPVSLPNVEKMREQDRHFDLFFSKLYASIFAEEPTRTPEQQKRGDKLFYLHSKQNLGRVLTTLKKASVSWKQKIREERRKILSVVNQDHQEDRVTFEELQRFFGTGEITALKRVKFSPQNYSLIQEAFGRYLVQKTRLDQIERALQFAEKAFHSIEKGDKEKTEEVLESLAHELRTKRIYDLNMSPQLACLYLIFESTFKTMLWEQQAETLQNVLEGKEANVVMELLMSFGKTFFGIPTIAAHQANGDQIVMLLWPPSMYETNTSQISRQSALLCGQTVHALKVNRNMPLTDDRLDAILMLLERARTNKGVLSLTPKDVQALDLLLVEILRKASRAQKYSYSALQKLQRILFIIQTKGKAIGDEAHELITHNKQLNYTAGALSTLPITQVQAMQFAMHYLLEDEEILQRIRKKNGLISFSKEAYFLRIKAVAERMAAYFVPENSPAQKELELYLRGCAKEIPGWIKKHRHAQAIYMARGILSQLFPNLILGHSVHVHFGESHQNNGEYARPYSSNDHPVEESTYQSPYEAHIKSLVMLLHKGLDKTQIRDVCDLLYQKAREQNKELGISPELTSYGRCLTKWFPEIEFRSSLFYEPIIPKEIGFDQEIIFHYHIFFITPQITYFEGRMSSNSHNLCSMFASGFYDTGTPYNAGIYPGTLLARAGTLEKAIDVIKSKSTKDCIHKIQATTPPEVLDEVLRDYFKAGTHFTALIDGGAQLTGLNNRTVAEKMVLHTKENRPDIRAIDFFDVENGKEVLLSWEIGSDKPISREKCTAELGARLCYFDQSHGFAADIPQKSNAKGLHLVGEKHPRYSFLQEAFRLRGLKKYTEFTGIENDRLSPSVVDASNLTKTQTINYAFTSQVCKAITGSSERLPNIDEMLAYMAKQQFLLLEEVHYRGSLGRMEDIVRSHVRKKYLVASPKQAVRLFKEFEEFFVFPTCDDPEKLFGQINEEISPQKALEQTKERLLKKIAKSRSFSVEENRAIEKELQNIIDKIEKEKLSLPKSISTISSQFGIEVEQESEQQSEVIKEQQTQTQTQVHHCSKKLPSFKEQEWDPEFDPHIDNAWNFIPSFQLKEKTTIVQSPSLYKVPYLVGQSNSKNLRAIAKYFDDRLWMSNNFIPQSTLLSSAIGIGTVGQRPIFEVLIEYHESAEKECVITAVGCLSQQEATYWREKIRIEKQGSYKKYVLYDVTLQRIVVGKDIEPGAFEDHEDLLRLETQLKFLDGDIRFEKLQHIFLKKWARQDYDQFSSAFTSIVRERQMGGARNITLSTLIG